MTKPTTPSLLRHLIFWALWFAYEFWGYYGSLAQFTPMLWTQTAYNCLSLLTATYITYYYALRFFRSAPSFIEFWDLPLVNKYKLLGNKYLLGIVSVVFIHIGLSLWLDSKFFAIPQIDMVLQFKGRFTKLRDLLALTVLYSALKVYVSQAKRELFIADYKIKIRDEVLDLMKTLYAQLKTGMG